MSSVFDKATAELKIKDFAGELPALPKLEQASSLDIMRENGLVGGQRNSLDIAGDMIRNERRRKQLAKLDGNAQSLSGIPSWGDAVTKIQGFDQLPYDQQKKLYDQYIKQATTVLQQSNPKEDAIALEQKVRDASPPPVDPAGGRGDLSRGWQSYVRNTKAVAAGALGYALSKFGADETGKSLMETALSYTKDAQDVGKANDAFTEALKPGGSLVDWAQFNTGQLLGSVLESAATGLAGAAIGGAAGGVGAIPGGLAGFLGKSMVKREVFDLVKAEMIKDARSAMVKGVARDQALKQARDVAEQKLLVAAGRAGGALTAMLGASGTRGVGEIVQQAQGAGIDPTTLSAFDVGTGAGLYAALETFSDKLLLDSLMKGVAGGAVKRTVKGAAANAATEGLTEVGQDLTTGIASGAGAPDFTSLLNSFAAGAVGGGALGGAAALARPAESAPAAPTATPGATIPEVGDPEIDDGTAADAATVAPGTIDTSTGSTLVMGEDGRWGYAEGAEPNPVADGLIAAQPAPTVAEPAAPVDTTVPPTDLVPTDDGDLALGDPVAANTDSTGKFTDPSISLPATNFADVDVSLPTVNQLDAKMVELFKLVRDNPLDTGALQNAEGYLAGAPGRMQLDAIKNNPNGATAFFAKRLGLSQMATRQKSSPWARELTQATDTSTVLEAIEQSPQAGEVNQQVAGAIRQAYTEAGIPFPAMRYDPNVQRTATGFVGGEYSIPDHVIFSNPNTTANAVNHEAMHGLTAQGIRVLQERAYSGNREASQVIYLMETLHRKLIAAARNENTVDKLYGNSNLYEMFAELSNPVFVSLAAKTKVGSLDAEARAGLKTVNATVSDSLLEAFTKITAYIVNALTGRSTIAPRTVLDLLNRTAAYNAVLAPDYKNLSVFHEQGTALGDRLKQQVFHGTPHDVDQFSMQKIGTGEGAQAYGWGAYFAGKKEVAEFYRRGLTDRNFVNLARDSYDEFTSPQDALDELRSNPELSPAQVELLDALQADDWLGFDYPHQAISEVLRRPQNWELTPETQAALKKQGNTYQVEVPNDNTLLDWDKALVWQPKGVQDALDDVMREKFSPQQIEHYEKNWDSITGRELYGELSQRDLGGEDAARAASEALLAAGIPGLRYLDGGSRAKGDGTYNYVIWDETRIGAPERLYSKTTPVSQAAVTQQGATNITGNATSTTEPANTYDQLIDNLDNGVGAAATTPSREFMQAMNIKGGRGRAAVTAFRSFGDKLNEEFHNAQMRMERWLRTLPEGDGGVTALLKQSVVAAMYRSRGIKNQLLSDVMEDHGGRDMQRLIAEFSKKYKVSLETAAQHVGYWITAQRVPAANQILIQKDIERLAEAQARLEEARNAPSMQEELDPATMTPEAAAAAANAPLGEGVIDELQREVALAQRQVLDRMAAVNNPATTVRKHGGGGVAGMNNAQAAQLTAKFEAKYGREDMQAIAEQLYTMNAWKLALDLETGKSNPAITAKFLRQPDLQGLFGELRDLAQNVTARDQNSVEALNAKRREVMDAVRSNYVPLAGRLTDIDDEAFYSGSRAPNVQRDYALEGRTTTFPSDAITNTFNATLKSATYAGWRDFQDDIATVYRKLTPEQREAAGIHMEELKPGASTVRSGAIVRARNGKAYAYWFDDEQLVESIRGANRFENNALLAGMGKLTKVYAYAATQLNPFFAPFNLFRDAWERSELMRTRDYFAENGDKVDSKSLAHRMIRNLATPGLFRATMRHAFGLPVQQSAREARYLEEFLRQGGVSIFNDQFAADRSKMIKEISKQTGWRKQLDTLATYISSYNKTLDIGPALAAYMAMRDAGMSAADAAGGSLDLMNFGKKGKSANVFSALYAFAQPSFTGGANAMSALYNANTGKWNKVGVTRLAGYIIVFTALQAMLRSMADEDEGGNKLDQQSPFMKNNFMLIPYGEDGMIKVPLAYGLTRFANGVARAMIGMGTDEQTPGEALGKVASGSVVPVFSPIEDSDIDWSERPLQALITLFSPSWAKPVVAVATNTTPYDTKVVNDRWGKTGVYRSEQFGKYVPEEWRDLARFLRETTGADMAPEEVRSLVKGYPLGVGNMVINGLVENPYKGKDAASAFTEKLYTPYSEFARYFQFKEAIDETDDLLKAKNAGEAIEDPVEQAKLRWRLTWDEQDKDLRAAKAKITRSKQLSESAKATQRDAADDARMAAQIRALQQFRLMQGKASTTTAQ